VTPETLARLTESGIQLVCETKGYVLLTRGACMAMARLSVSGPPDLGSSGIMTDSGLAYLVERGGQAFLSGKGGEVPAATEQVETLRTFSQDLKAGFDVPVL
jgi:hypothetical protein